MSKGLAAAIEGTAMGDVRLRTRGSLRARALLWFLGWGPRLFRLSEDRTLGIMMWSLKRVCVQKQVVHGGAWVTIATGWDYVRQARG